MTQPIVVLIGTDAVKHLDITLIMKFDKDEPIVVLQPFDGPVHIKSRKEFNELIAMLNSAADTAFGIDSEDVEKLSVKIF